MVSDSGKQFGRRGCYRDECILRLHWVQLTLSSRTHPVQVRRQMDRRWISSNYWRKFEISWKLFIILPHKMCKKKSFFIQYSIFVPPPPQKSAQNRPCLSLSAGHLYNNDGRSKKLKRRDESKRYFLQRATLRADHTPVLPIFFCAR